MTLKTRLSQLQSQAGGRQKAPTLSHQPNALKIPHRVGQPNRDSSHRPHSDSRLAEQLEGRLIAEGVIQIEKQIPLNSKLGAMQLSELQTAPQLPGDDRVTLKNYYLDTETTGLSGGSGTLAFLIGYAWMERSAICLRQLLITRFSAETKMLEKIALGLETAERLVSYNGKSYDLPLLISRFRISSRKQQFDRLPHLDLLHPTRRLFRHHWPNCRLATLEQRLLGYHRVGDLPGSEAPAAWFDYLQRGSEQKLLKVVEHNQNDIVSLVAAHTELARITREPDRYDLDLYSLARWIGKFDREQACDLLRKRVEQADERSKGYLAHLLQKSGDWQGATQLWYQLAQNRCPEALEKLAKYHEHVSKDLEAARHYCRQLPDCQARTHRLRRLQRKADLRLSPAYQFTVLQS
ncbi:MAG: ribonuclease H-like domain-containing protein [Candidatus Thiodiazotropha lotti]|nr:ribonuclease H-like domain-containing protein [Candidatus Thiodiazotropha lotti]MCG7929012.1 ribonuclease H-like domain-containing protein [Candidatus Thiodiazotropha lotti]MCG7986262.1 ribonuclease H-like domain-containing protein [Candidatus Thiodiazotropha lotti]MCG8004008.1 ribonuclease H-like domain-containing protein [Candidatus Thiodiazotropha lotti]MCG8009068.1 ribonuclease H-like domain-containing protein [Candidatus Thiodiazotropha lotti]